MRLGEGGRQGLGLGRGPPRGGEPQHGGGGALISTRSATWAALSGGATLLPARPSTSALSAISTCVSASYPRASADPGAALAGSRTMPVLEYSGGLR